MKLHEEFKIYENMWNNLTEFVDKNGNKVTLSKSASSTSSSSTTDDKVYAWNMWTGSSTYGHNDWISAEYENGVLEGEVFSTEQNAIDAGYLLLWELYDDLELATHPDNFNIDVIEYPKSDLNNKVNLVK